MSLCTILIVHTLIHPSRRMGAVGPTSDPGVVADFPWDALAKGKDAIVDVGGGQGTLCCSLAVK